MEKSIDNNFRDFFKNNIDFLFILDQQGNIQEVNNAVNSILGYSDEEIIGKNVLMVHPPEFRDDAAEIVRKMMTGEESYCPIPLLTKSNEYIPVETRVFPGIWDSKQVLIGVSRNLTALKLSEEKFQAVFHNGPALMAISRVDTGAFVDVNKLFLDTLGYTRKEILGLTSIELNLFYNYEQRNQALEIFAKEGRLENFEAIVKTKSGDLLNCFFFIEKFRVQTYEFILTAATNITPLRKAESKVNYLYEQQKLLADISQQFNSLTNIELVLNDVLRLIGAHTRVSRVYICENDQDGATSNNTYEWCNNGISPQIKNLQGIPYSSIPSWKQILIEKGRIFSTNISELPQDIIHYLKPQEIKSTLVYPMYVENTFYGFIGFDECVINRIWTDEEMDLLRAVSNNISMAFERRQVIQKLENSELRLRLAISGANEGLWDWNNETGHVYFNDTWLSMLGYEPGEIEPNVSSWEKLVHPADMPMVMEVLTRHLNGITPYYETVHRVKTKDGSWKWILDHGMVVLRNSNNQPVRTVGTHIDVTRQKETENQLQELIRTKDKLFSIIAHDLRGPIGNLLPILEMLYSGEESDENVKDILMESLKKGIKSTYGLLENLLNWSLSQTNEISLNPKHFIINTVISNNIELLVSGANRKEIHILFNVDDDLSVFADEDSISLVIRNLLSNAIKFTPNQGTIEVFIKKGDSYIEIEIVDNGVGMTKEVLDSLFNTNTSVSTMGTNNEKGSGLGLILCKEFVERNGGQIRAESTPGKGSKFIFTVPRTK
jgi:PAS domain S-box-containing protein